MPAAAAPWPSLGAAPGPEGTHVCVWAPSTTRLSVRLAGGDHPLIAFGDGLFRGVVPAGPGDDYRCVPDDGRALPDPCSRFQPRGIDGPSRVVDPAAFGWTDSAWPGVPLDELVIYELHVGTFSPAGTFDAVIPRLSELRALGVTAIELMPVATFPGERGWGYDAVYSFAPHPAYGGPQGLDRLVDAAHGAGLGVILDVVYNHIGPGSEAVAAFAPYFTDRHRTFWGPALDYARRGVREWAIQNAEMWVRDHHVDGLRLDAVHAIVDECEPPVLAELAARVHAARPGALVISEMETGDLRPIQDWGHDAQWEDALHHAAHVLLTGEREGYYERYGRVADLARELCRPEGRRLVVCAQNHDQVGNRATGDRLHGAKLRLAAFCAILSRGTPLLFMGEEYDEPHPFQFFAGHADPAIAEATREGRRREFAHFSAFGAEGVPDPQDAATFRRSTLGWEDGDPAQRAYYAELLRLRREIGEAAAEVVLADEERRLLVVRRGATELRMNFSDHEQDGVPPWSGSVRR